MYCTASNWLCCRNGVTCCVVLHRQPGLTDEMSRNHYYSSFQYLFPLRKSGEAQNINLFDGCAVYQFFTYVRIILAAKYGYNIFAASNSFCIRLYMPEIGTFVLCTS